MLVIYQHPLAYLLGLEGVALLRAFAGHYDRDFTEARLAEVRALLRSAGLLGPGVETRPVTAGEGYRAWAEDYDQPGNGLIDLEQPVMQDILDGLPRGTAVDAACGTGRHARYLMSAGYEVIGDFRSDWPVVKALPGQDYGHLPHRNHLASDYLAAALPLGFQVRRCEEPRLPYPAIDPDARPPAAPPDHPSDIWSLWPWCPATVNAVYRDTPVLIVWHFQLGSC